MIDFETRSPALLTDLCQLTMGYGYWKNGIAEREAVYYIFFRRKPFGQSYALMAGLEGIIDYLKSFRFTSEDLAYLSSLTGDDGRSLFDQGYLTYLSQLQFTGTIDAMPEGTVVCPYEPMLRIQGPLLQCQLLETPLLNLINFPTLIATKAARICCAAQGDMVLEFGLRRAHGPDGAMTASRASYIGGCHATSNVLAGKMFGISVKGTQGHSWIMLYDDEPTAFEQYADAMPYNTVLLVDTYDTFTGVDNAIRIGHALRKRGSTLFGIRLDSGDLASLSDMVRKKLDAAGFTETKIIASSNLDEYAIAELKRKGAAITVWGVGTNLVTAKGQSAIDGVYKLSAIRDASGWSPRAKISEEKEKSSFPGILQVRRYQDGERYVDAIYDTTIGIDNGTQFLVTPGDNMQKISVSANLPSTDLLVPIFSEGICVYQKPALDDIRRYALKEQHRFSIAEPDQHISVGIEMRVHEQKMKMMHKECSCECIAAR